MIEAPFRSPASGGKGLVLVFQRTFSKINSFGSILPAQNTVTNDEQPAPRREDEGQVESKNLTIKFHYYYFSSIGSK